MSRNPSNMLGSHKTVPPAVNVPANVDTLLASCPCPAPMYKGASAHTASPKDYRAQSLVFIVSFQPTFGNPAPTQITPSIDVLDKSNVYLGNIAFWPIVDPIEQPYTLHWCWSPYTDDVDLVDGTSYNIGLRLLSDASAATISVTSSSIAILAGSFPGAF